MKVKHFFKTCSNEQVYFKIILSSCRNGERKQRDTNQTWANYKTG